MLDRREDGSSCPGAEALALSGGPLAAAGFGAWGVPPSLILPDDIDLIRPSQAFDLRQRP